MSLEDLIYRNRKRPVANANPANTAKGGANISKISNISVSKVSRAETANDPASIPADCVGALRDPDGGAYLPWGPYLSPDDVRRMRGDLVAMIEQLSTIEGWGRDHLDDVLTRAIRGPLADLLPNLHHFRERLKSARTAAEQEARRRAQAWRCEALDARGYCDGCDGSCIGTRRSCTRTGEKS